MPQIFRLVTALAVAVSAFAAQPSFAKDEYAFVGKWDCDGNIFTFTDKVYNNGSEDLEIKKVEDFGGGTYALTFADDYAIGVSVTGDTMGWVSQATGDGFECKRVK